MNVQARKTILSYGSGGDVFRFIEEGTQNLLEFEDGVGNNESVTYATRTAIEASVGISIPRTRKRFLENRRGKRK